MYNSNKIAERIKTTAKLKGVTVKKMLEDVGLNYNTMASLKVSMPRADNLAKIADYLECSVDYLLGRVDDPNVHENEIELLTNYRQLNSTGQERLLNYSIDLNQIDQYKKCDISENVG